MRIVCICPSRLQRLLKVCVCVCVTAGQPNPGAPTSGSHLQENLDPGRPLLHHNASENRTGVLNLNPAQNANRSIKSKENKVLFWLLFSDSHDLKILHLCKRL